MSARNIAQARLLANICPAMLDQMARNDLPDQRQLRVIAAATKEEQADVWKKCKPRRGFVAPWDEITRALGKIRIPARNAKFSDAEAEAFGIVWDNDLFAPADEDGRTTCQVDAFLAAQTAWLEANLGAGSHVVEVDDYLRPKLPKGAQPHYGQPGEGVFTAVTIDSRSGVVRETFYTLPPPRSGGAGAAGDGDDREAPARKSRPDVTAKGAAIIGDLRTDALHRALREKPIDDDQLIAMLVLAIAGQNVTVHSGVTGTYRVNPLGRIAEGLTEGGVLTRDLAAIRGAAREALVTVLSCRANQSASGMGARHAGAAIDADAFLPNMATEEFLPSLSRAALETCAAAISEAPQARVKDTRAALIARFSEGTFIYPGARFAPSGAELEAKRNQGNGTDVREDDAAVGEGELDEFDDGVLDDDDPDSDDETAAPERHADEADEARAAA
jgi:hypothetical protein